jgi:hypothetical protein
VGVRAGKAVMMPSTSEKQRRMMCADYRRAKAGKKTSTGMRVQALKEFCAGKIERR